jgi:hypothetical protein
MVPILRQKSCDHALEVVILYVEIVVRYQIDSHLILFELVEVLADIVSRFRKSTGEIPRKYDS